MATKRGLACAREARRAVRAGAAARLGRTAGRIAIIEAIGAEVVSRQAQREVWVAAAVGEVSSQARAQCRNACKVLTHQNISRCLARRTV